MVASVNASNSYIAQSEKNQNNSSAKSKPLSSSSANENQFVKKPENRPSGFNLDISYKLEISESAAKTFSILNGGSAEEKETDKSEAPPVEVKTLVENKKMANKSTSKINNATVKSAVKLYTIIKNDILLDNHFDLKTGSVNFFA